jgi:YfiH family protein
MKFAEVRFTGRAEGDMGRTDEPATPARERLLEQLGLEGAAAAHQVHGSVVARVREAPSGYALSARDADGQATTLRGAGVAVHVADCLPVAVAGAGGVAMLHAGWRGLAAGVLAQGVRALRELGVEGPLEAAVGPGAGVCCYEAGTEVHREFSGVSGASRGANVDLRAVAHALLADAGVGVVEDCGGCTICDPALFSHRRGDGGRQVGIAWLR